MTPFFVAIFLLGLSSLATAANFTQVFEWIELDFEWPSEASRTQALEDGTYKPAKIYPRYMAVHGTRIFLSLYKNSGIPATLVSLPTSSASSAPPKLTPFPSLDLHLNESGNCEKIHTAEGLQVDSVGRLWVLDEGSFKCNTKLRIFDLYNSETEIIHRFSFHGKMHDLVIDETANGTFAYIAWWSDTNIVAFSLEKNESWIVDTPGVEVLSIALSPKEEPRQLYLGEFYNDLLYSISVAALRNGTRTAEPELIGNWTGTPYRMLVDNHGTLHAAILSEDYASSWNTSREPFQEQRFYEVAGLDYTWPFTFALDQNGTLWMTVLDDAKTPRFRILKAKSYIFEDSPECSGSCPKSDTA
ncbi:protein yellow-like [Cloeon dipterum]|uniref:protein yellow-like n=1 Tax=Cloeon dipterum TaxID=197152 RepID=UPI003220184B